MAYKEYENGMIFNAQELNALQELIQADVNKIQENLKNEINNLSTYSTDEVNTGEKWIDGKTIYKKLIVAKGLSTTTRISEHTIAQDESLDTAWLDGGFCYYPENKYQYPLDSNIGVVVQISAYNNRLLFINDNGQGRTMDFYAIVKYTKSNNTAEQTN